MRLGSALPAVLLALAMTSALAVGGAYVSRALVTSARHTQRGADLRPAAEAALVEALAAWDSVARGAQPIGTTNQLAVPVSGEGEPAVSAWVTRTSDCLYWLTAESNTSTRPVLHRRIGAIVRSTGGNATLAHPRSWSELP